MIFQLVLLTILLTILFFISKNIIRQIYSFIQKIFKNKKAAVWGMAILFLPGTVQDLKYIIQIMIIDFI
ncbi:hypothetical protein A2153_02835 [Candidatus Gottesmanbacteria bacterium RBG_16_38_7b]|uniref:Uncharacterized protein n=1 Tax=Candidatus Gottesmanbacteria bacterium RBG_16_38_7b TaxID=1798372 RepID=A0A1F5YFN7_9BACT|nr:MAG: hypothetical protein A2153_02835 [Candidatus Gottesmanbacteria bacterium RBG_16_38_7b]